ncbi:MAG: PQQ-dependent sugar dehydrogenase [Methylocystis sp.]
MTGPAAYGDWRQDSLGTWRLIQSSDMPAETGKHIVSNAPPVVARPKGAMPKAPAGFSVSILLADLREPRLIRAAPNGDIFLAESGAKRIRVIRPSAAEGEKVQNSVFVDGLKERPFGIAFYPPGAEPRYVYIATDSRVLRFPYQPGDTTARGPGEVVAHLPRGGHWTRDIQFTPDGQTMLVSVGSASNIAEDGLSYEEDRADILAFDADGKHKRIYASGLRNPVAIAFYPGTEDLWTTVNERDGLGNDLPPDYFTKVVPGGFYGWPWYYIGPHRDSRVKGQSPVPEQKVLIPDVLFQPHSAPLGFAFYTGKAFPSDYGGDAFVAFHGSWNRARPTGYKIVRVKFENGKPTGAYEDFLTGFLTLSGQVWGRPVGVAVASDGALLVTDDAGGVVWRIQFEGR